MEEISHIHRGKFQRFPLGKPKAIPQEMLAGTGRERAAQMISGGFVSINHRETLSTAARVHDGDVISIRRCGRFIIDALGPKTKKGRLSIRCRKYI